MFSAFIDDTAMEEELAFSVQRAFEQLVPIDDSDDSDDAEELASAVERRAEMRGYNRRRASTLPLGDAEDVVPENVPKRLGKFLVIDLVNLPTIQDPELYRVTLEPGREWSFLQWIITKLIPSDAKASKILSAFSRPAEPGVVYIETTSRATLQWALQQQRMRIQGLVPVAERASLLWEPLGYREGWGRITKGRAYKGDLVLVYDATDRGALWRQRDSKTKAFRLFRPVTHAGEVKWLEDGSCVYGGITYLQGLLAKPVAVERLSQKNVNPTEEEMEGFRHVVHQRVDFADHAPDALGIATGDRVVVAKDFFRARSEKDPQWKDCRAGWILAIRVIESERVAAVCKNYGHNSTQTQVPPDSVFYVPVRHLEHHVLRIPRTLEIQDRVLVVDGKYTGEMGRVVELHTDPLVVGKYTVTLQPLPPPREKGAENDTTGAVVPPAITVDRSQVVPVFMRGDYVEITRGPHKNRSGFIVEVRYFGVVSIFQASPWRFILFRRC